jgi:hypothetical protein
MAEKIVSPGVFTRENDLSFLSQGIGEIGAAIIGPFHKGPAFYQPLLIHNRNSKKYSEHLMVLTIQDTPYKII